LKQKKQKLAQFAERVFGVLDGSIEEKATKGIEKMEAFFHSIDIPTHLSDYIESYKGTAEEIESRFTKRNWLGLGEHKSITPEIVREIVEMSY